MTHDETELALTFCNAPLGLLSADLRAAFDAHVAAGGQTMAYLTSGWAVVAGEYDAVWARRIVPPLRVAVEAAPSGERRVEWVNEYPDSVAFFATKDEARASAFDHSNAFGIEATRVAVPFAEYREVKK